jgi:SAM-dependent methyltransferase
MEKKTGLHSALSIPLLYNLFQRMVGAERVRRKVVDELIRPHAGDRVLDIGCGTGEWYPFLGRVDYHGFDACLDYILTARENHPTGKFTCQVISEHSLEQSGQFNIALAIGILHHLDDKEASQLFALAQKALKPGGRLITLDPCYDQRQSRMAKWIISCDRGKNTRREQDYVTLAGVGFSQIKPNLWLHPLRIPYTYCILECQK